MVGNKSRKTSTQHDLGRRSIAADSWGAISGFIGEWSDRYGGVMSGLWERRDISEVRFGGYVVGAFGRWSCASIKQQRQNLTFFHLTG